MTGGIFIFMPKVLSNHGVQLRTRFMLAQEVADKKDGFNATNLLNGAAVRAGKIPAEFVSDCLPSYWGHSTPCMPHATP